MRCWFSCVFNFDISFNFSSLKRATHLPPFPDRLGSIFGLFIVTISLLPTCKQMDALTADLGVNSNFRILKEKKYLTEVFSLVPFASSVGLQCALSIPFREGLTESNVFSTTSLSSWFLSKLDVSI